MKTYLALMGAASFYGGVHHKKYSGQQETAPEKYNGFYYNRSLIELIMKINRRII
jgi:hypothetical protein